MLINLSNSNITVEYSTFDSSNLNDSLPSIMDFNPFPVLIDSTGIYTKKADTLLEHRELPESKVSILIPPKKGIYFADYCSNNHIKSSFIVSKFNVYKDDEVFTTDSLVRLFIPNYKGWGSILVIQ